MKTLDQYLMFVKKPKYINVQRRETFGREEYVISYAPNFFIIFQMFSTKLYMYITHDELPNEFVIYDPGMNHIIFDIDTGGNSVRYTGIKKYLSEDYAFQQSLLQEPLFSTEDLEYLFAFHEELDRRFNSHKYHKDSECTFLNSSISFVKKIFSSSK